MSDFIWMFTHSQTHKYMVKLTGGNILAHASSRIHVCVTATSNIMFSLYTRLRGLSYAEGGTERERESTLSQISVCNCVCIYGAIVLSCHNRMWFGYGRYGSSVLQ